MGDRAFDLAVSRHETRQPALVLCGEFPGHLTLSLSPECLSAIPKGPRRKGCTSLRFRNAILIKTMEALDPNRCSALARKEPLWGSAPPEVALWVLLETTGPLTSDPLLSPGISHDMRVALQWLLRTYAFVRFQCVRPQSPFRPQSPRQPQSSARRYAETSSAHSGSRESAEANTPTPHTAQPLHSAQPPTAERRRAWLAFGGAEHLQLIDLPHAAQKADIQQHTDTPARKQARKYEPSTPLARGPHVGATSSSSSSSVQVPGERLEEGRRAREGDTEWESDSLWEGDDAGLLALLLHLEALSTVASAEHRDRSHSAEASHPPMASLEGKDAPPRDDLPTTQEGRSVSITAALQRAAKAKGFVPSPLQHMYLVCTHGRRDPCCATLGIPLYQALQAIAPAQTWQTSHLGGHRFAPVIAVLPSGYGYGRLAPDDMPTWHAAHARGHLSHLPNLRGASRHPAPAQYAECALRAELNETDMQAWQLIACLPMTSDHRESPLPGTVSSPSQHEFGQTWQVRFRHRPTGAVHTYVVAEHVTEAARPPSCGAAPQRIKTFQHWRT